MKILFIIVLSMFLAGNTRAQKTNTDSNKAYSGYMQKSKKQKAAAWILLGSGAAMGMTGLLVTGSELNNNWWDMIVQDQKINPTGEILFYTGVAAMIGSIPLFIASTKNRKKAEDLHTFFKMRQLPVPGAYTTKLMPYPSFTVILKL